MLKRTRKDDLTHQVQVRIDRAEAQRHLLSIRRALEAVRKGQTPSNHFLAWPAGLNRSLMNSLPLSNRTRNRLSGANLVQGSNALTVGELLSIWSFGMTSLSDLLFVTETYLRRVVDGSDVNHRDSATITRDTQNRHHSSSTTVHPVIEDHRRIIESAGPSDEWEYVHKLLKPIFSTMVELYGTRSLADVLNSKCMNLATKMNIADNIEKIELNKLAFDRGGTLTQALDLFAEISKDAVPFERRILEGRIFALESITLDQIASEFYYSRERVRQVQRNIEREFISEINEIITPTARVLKEEFGHIALRIDVENRLESILPDGPAFARKLLVRALIKLMSYKGANDLLLDHKGEKMAKNIRSRAEQFADDVGLVDKNKLMQKFPSNEWKSSWPLLRRHCALFELNGQLAIRQSIKARIKAAIIAMGRPATVKEIVAKADLVSSKIGAHLWAIDSVIRADKQRWGLREWIDDEYQGIVAEIVQRIEEDGGVTTTKRLVQELPEKFGVKPKSVEVYMATPKFKVKNGYIWLASQESVELRPLDDVIHGRDVNDAPYWTFTVDQRLFDGRRLTSVPPEVATALGCKPDDRVSVRLCNLPGCRNLNVYWRLSSTTDASIGRLCEPLERLGLRPGDQARITIKGFGMADLARERGNMHDGFRASTHAETMLERIKRRRRTL